MSDLSAKQLKKAQGIANVDVSFRQLGNVDVKMGIKVGKHMYLIIFEGFTCHSVRKMTAKEVRETDFMIEMSPAQWDKFIAGCQSGKGPTLAQLDDSENVIKAADPRRKLDFLRYHTSIQAFFEVYANLESTPA